MQKAEMGRMKTFQDEQDAKIRTLENGRRAQNETIGNVRPFLTVSIFEQEN